MFRLSQVDGVPEKSTERFVGSAGLVKIGEEFVPARWLHLPKCAVVFAVCDNGGKRFKITQNARFHI